MSLQMYAELFRHLKVNSSSGHQKPHKACLLLAVIDLIDAGRLTENKVIFDQQLRDAFSRRFELFKRGNDKDNPVNPFFYLSSSGFWNLKAKHGKDAELRERLQIRAAGGVGVLNKLVAYASLSPELFALLRDSNARNVLAGALEGTLLSMSESFTEWCRSIGKSDKTISNYVGALSGPMSQWASEQLGRSIELTNVEDSSQLLKVRETLATYEIFQERNRIGKGMYAAALNLWEKFLAERASTELTEQDVKEIQSRDIDSTVKEILVGARRGQGLFRNRVLQLWDRRCALTGYSDVRFLVASHIKPWKSSDDSERLDGFNGFPLIPSIDKAFDLGFISFDTGGKIMLSSELEKPETLGIREGQSILVLPRQQRYLEFHREELFTR